MDDKELKDILAQSESTDIRTLLSAKENAKRNVLDNPSPANLRAFEKASQMLQKTMGGDTGGTRYKNRAEALRVLQAKGYKIQHSKFYNDIDKKKLCHMNPDGSITESALARYINDPRTGLVRHDPIEDQDPGLQDLDRRKKEAEIKKIKLAIKKETFQYEKEQGLHMPRSQVEMEIVSRAIALKSIIEHWITLKNIEWGHMDPAQRLADMKDGLNQHLTEFANTKQFHVILTDDTDHNHHP
ncbi:MAG: hypothetical protein HKM93_01180 [Desulfobacteraceae bacterium]|nr:hypothetical protein [Desulfobacteraceae bacterium]